MGDFYELSQVSTGDANRVATRLTHQRVFAHRLDAEGRIDDPPELTWSWATTAPLADLVWTVDAIRLVSPVVRGIFDYYRTPADEIQWLPGTVISADGIRLPHWVSHFPVHYDLLDTDRTTWGPSGLPIRYVLDREKLAPHAVTAIPQSVVTYVVSEPVADALRAAEVRGVRITLAPTN